MTVGELIEVLQTMNDDMEIKYSSSSEGIQMSISSIDIEKDMNDLNQDIVVIEE